jgi:hypothetical protein
MALTAAALSTAVPSTLVPESRCIRAKLSRSRGRIASIEPAGAFDRARPQTRSGPGLVVGIGLDVAERSPVHDRLVRSGRGVSQPERREQPLADAVVEWPAADDLDDPAQDAETGVVVGEHLARGEELGEIAQRGDVLLDAVIALAGVGEDVTLEARGVAQQLANGDRRGGGLVGETEGRDVRAHRGVEVDQPFVDELHDQRRRPYLGDGADLEERVGVRRYARRLVEQAGTEIDHLAAGIHGHRRTRHLVLGQQLRQAVLQPRLDVVEGGHRPTVGGRPRAVFVPADERCGPNPSSRTTVRPRCRWGQRSQAGQHLRRLDLQRGVGPAHLAQGLGVALSAQLEQVG